jgi:hypothetical protein
VQCLLWKPWAYGVVTARTQVKSKNQPDLGRGSIYRGEQYAVFVITDVQVKSFDFIWVKQMKKIATRKPMVQKKKLEW